jgi:hypothetical protein
MMDMYLLLLGVGVLLVILAFVLLRGAARTYGVFAALLVLAVLVWFGESILLGVFGTETPGRVRGMSERIDYGDGTQPRHVFEVMIVAADDGDETLRVDAGSFDAVAPGAAVVLRTVASGTPLAMKKLSSQPLDRATPGWLKYVSIVAVALWTALALPRFRALVLALIAAGVLAFTAVLPSPDAGAPSMRGTATVRAVQPIKINRGGNDEGARYLFAINDQLLMPEALVSAEFVEFEFVPANRSRPVLAVDVLRAGTVITGATMDVAYTPAAPRAARSLASTRAPASAGLSPWIFAAAACAVLAGLEWLGRRLSAGNSSAQT